MRHLCYDFLLYEVPHTVHSVYQGFEDTHSGREDIDGIISTRETYMIVMQIPTNMEHCNFM